MNSENGKHIYLMHGFIGSGKTTFAMSLAKEKRAIRLTHDEFMVDLYGTNPPADKFPEFYDRITKLIWKLAGELVELSVPVILDFGFWNRRSRDEALEKVRDMGAQAHIYSMQCDREVMKKRCLDRTRAGGNALMIDEPAFEKLFKLFEPLSADETATVVRTD